MSDPNITPGTANITPCTPPAPIPAADLRAGRRRKRVVAQEMDQASPQTLPQPVPLPDNVVESH